LETRTKRIKGKEEENKKEKSSYARNRRKKDRLESQPLACKKHP
jgi:hypothetical protein